MSDWIRENHFKLSQALFRRLVESQFYPISPNPQELSALLFCPFNLLPNGALLAPGVKGSALRRSVMPSEIRDCRANLCTPTELRNVTEPGWCRSFFLQACVRLRRRRLEWPRRSFPP